MYIEQHTLSAQPLIISLNSSAFLFRAPSATIQSCNQHSDREQ